MRKKWRCFHCDFITSNRGEAEVHFGADSGSEPLCVLKTSDDHLGVYIRDLEKQLDQYRAEDSHVLRAMASLEANHHRALIMEEEKGYERGLRDGMALRVEPPGMYPDAGTPPEGHKSADPPNVNRSLRK